MWFLFVEIEVKAMSAAKSLFSRVKAIPASLRPENRSPKKSLKLAAQTKVQAVPGPKQPSYDFSGIAG